MTSIAAHSPLIANEFAEEAAEQAARLWRLWGGRPLEADEVEELTTYIWDGLLHKH